MISVFYYPFKYLHRNVRKPSQMGGHTPYFGNFVKVTPGQTSGQLNLSVVMKVSHERAEMLQTIAVLWFNHVLSLKLWGRLVQRNAANMSGNVIRWRNEDSPWRRSSFDLSLAEFKCCPSAAQSCQLTPWVSWGKECRFYHRQVGVQLWGQCLPGFPWWLLISVEFFFHIAPDFEKYVLWK